MVVTTIRPSSQKSVGGRAFHMLSVSRQSGSSRLILQTIRPNTAERPVGLSMRSRRAAQTNFMEQDSSMTATISGERETHSPSGRLELPPTLRLSDSNLQIVVSSTVERSVVQLRRISSSSFSVSINSDSSSQPWPRRLTIRLLLPLPSRRRSLSGASRMHNAMPDSLSCRA